MMDSYADNYEMHRAVQPFSDGAKRAFKWIDLIIASAAIGIAASHLLIPKGAYGQSLQPITGTQCVISKSSKVWNSWGYGVTGIVGPAHMRATTERACLDYRKCQDLHGSDSTLCERERASWKQVWRRLSFCLTPMNVEEEKTIPPSGDRIGVFEDGVWSIVP